METAIICGIGILGFLTALAVICAITPGAAEEIASWWASIGGGNG